jgi:hypothetical protein
MNKKSKNHNTYERYIPSYDEVKKKVEENYFYSDTIRESHLKTIYYSMIDLMIHKK